MSDSNPSRRVYQDDAISWLERTGAQPGTSLVASLPDISEFPQWSLEQWIEWFIATAELILSCTPTDGVTIFFQSDIRYQGRWIDKGYLCQKAAERKGVPLLWHKIGCRVAPGNITYGRPAYSHILCFSTTVPTSLPPPTSDVLPSVGEKLWERGMGFEACSRICAYIAEHTPSRTVINPFCGRGGLLAVANAYGLSVVGLERSKKRAKSAEMIQADITGWKKGTW